jgi:hypothetical protein
LTKDGKFEDDTSQWQDMAMSLAKLGLAAQLSRQFSTSHARYMDPKEKIEMADFNAKFEHTYQTQWQTLVRKIRGLTAGDARRNKPSRRKSEEDGS